MGWDTGWAFRERGMHQFVFLGGWTFFERGLSFTDVGSDEGEEKDEGEGEGEGSEGRGSMFILK